MKKNLLFFNIVLGIGFINICTNLQTVPPAPPPPPAPILPRPSVPKPPVVAASRPPVAVASRPPVAVASKPLVAVAPKPKTTTKVGTVPFNLNPLIIHNLSSQEATLTKAICLINNKPKTITVKSSKIAPNSEVTISLKINIAENTSPTFTGYTSITIDNDILSVVHPDTKANYYGGSTIYINNINGTWRVVPKPTDKSKDKNSDKKNPKTKISNTKLAGAALEKKTPPTLKK